MAIQRLLSLSRRSSTLSLSSDALRSFSATSSAFPTTTTTSAPLPSPPRPDAMIYDRLASSINQKLKQLDSPDPHFLKEGEHAKESALALQNLLFLNRSSSSAIRSSLHFCGVGTSLWKSTMLPPLMPPSTQLFHTRPGLPSSTPSESSGNSKRFLKYLEYSTKQGAHAKDLDGGKTLNKAILMARDGRCKNPRDSSAAFPFLFLVASSLDGAFAVWDSSSMNPVVPAIVSLNGAPYLNLKKACSTVRPTPTWTGTGTGTGTSMRQCLNPIARQKVIKALFGLGFEGGFGG